MPQEAATSSTDSNRVIEGKSYLKIAVARQRDTRFQVFR
jgi:hypothetical protein